MSRAAQFRVLRLLAALFAFLMIAAACGSSENNASAPDDPGVTPNGTADVADPEPTDPPTTQTIPPEATAVPDLQINVVEFGDDGYVQIVNLGDEDVDVAGFRLCQFPNYLELATVIDGGVIGAGETVQIAASHVGGLDPSGGEAALYTRPEFTSSDAIFGFVQWGTGGARSEVAAEAGIWPSGASVTPDPQFNSIELFGDPADPEAWS